MKDDGHELAARFGADFAEHADFLRALARGVLGDEHGAEDVLQEARLAWTRRAPAPVDARRWLARAVRNLASNARRAEGRRARREAAAARPELVHGAIPGRLETQRRLVALVAALEEPARTVVYLRFYEGLPPRRVAERLGVPVSTVKMRLARALERLRHELDASFEGDRGAWCAALAPLAGSGAAAGAPSGPEGAASPVPTGWPVPAGGSSLLGGLVVNVKLALAVTVALVAAVAWTAWPEDDPVSAGAAVELAASVPDTLAPPDRPAALAPSTARAATEPEPLATALPGAQAAEGDVALALVVRVTDEERGALAGATVRARFAPAGASLPWTTSRTDGDGTARLPLAAPPELSPHAALSVEVAAEHAGFHPGHDRLHRVGLSAGDERRVEIALAPGAVARGRVVDAAGNAVSRASVAAVDDAAFVRGACRSDADGTFAVALEAGVVRFRVVALGEEAGWGVSRTVVAAVAEVAVGDVELARGASLEGVVRWADGTPAAGTVVHARRVAALDGSDDSVAHRELLEFDWGHWLRGGSGEAGRVFRGARARGHARTDGAGGFRIAALLPGRYALRFDESMVRSTTFGPFATDEPVEAVLDANRLRVRVVDTDGRPVPGADVLATGPRGSTSTNASGLEGAATVDGYPGLWTIRASASGAAAAEEELLVTRGTHEYEVRLELDFEPRTGDLRVVLDDGSGTRVSDFEVALFDGQERGFAPVYRGLEPDADGLVAGVPVGRWIARVRPREWRTATWFDVEADVDVLEGHTSELGLSTTRGGRIELVLAAAGGGPDEPTAVKVRVVDLYGAPIDSLDVVHRSLESGGVQYSSPRLGERGTSELLPAGTWVLAVEAEGWAPVERTVHVPAGETVPVEVELRRR